MSKIPSLNRAEAEFFRQMDEIATDVMASLDEYADDAAGGVSPEVEQWLRRGTTIVQELTTHVLALAAVSTEHERADLVRALDALQARLDTHVAAQPTGRAQRSALRVQAERSAAGGPTPPSSAHANLGLS